MGHPFTEQKPPKDVGEMVQQFNASAQEYGMKANVYIQSFFKK